MGAKISKENIIRALLDASFFYSAGATSLKDVADRLGIKKASLYNHFDSREDLIKQTLASCADYIQAITFTPKDIEAVAKQYPPATVFKGIVNRFFKMHEKAPLFQIYTFVESQKYFSEDAATIIKEENAKISTQTLDVLTALHTLGKITLPKRQLAGAATWFCAGIKDLLNIYLLERKAIVVNNPDSGEGQLFSLPEDGSGLEKVGVFVDNFVNIIK